jgi:hypothetical protein
MSFRPNRPALIWKIICDRCDDMGFVIGTARSGTNPFATQTWKELCPFCMPSNKYGNLQEQLRQANLKQLEHKRDRDDEDEWGMDEGDNSD